MNERFDTSGLDFHSQAFDLDIDRVRATVEVHVPYALSDEASGENFAFVLKKELEECKFLRAEVDAMPATRDASQLNVERKIVDFVTRIGGDHSSA